MPTRAFARRPLVAPLSVIAIAIAAIFGWCMKIETLVRPTATSAPMQINTAACFILISAALICLNDAKWSRTARFLALLCYAVSAVTAIQYFWEVDLGIDTLFVEPFTVVKTSHPGRMAPNTAFAFICSSLALVLLAGVPSRLSAIGSGMLTSLSFSVSALSLLGYLLGLESVDGWGGLSRMAISTAVAHIIVAWTLFVKIDSAMAIYPRLRRTWDGLAICFVGLLISVSLWMASIVSENLTSRSKLNLDVNLRTNIIRNEIETDIDLLRSIERFFSNSDFVSAVEYQGFVSELLAHNESIVAVDWAPRISENERAQFERDHAPMKMLGPAKSLIDRDAAPVYFPIAYSSASTKVLDAEGFDHYSDRKRAVAMDRAISLGLPQSTAPIQLFRLSDSTAEPSDFLIMVPVINPDSHPISASSPDVRGFLVGVFRLSTLVEQALHKIPPKGLEIDFFTSDSASPRSVFSTRAPGDTEPELGGRESTDEQLEIAGRTWLLKFTPTASYLEAERSGLPAAILLSSLVVTLFSATYISVIRRQRESLQESEERFRLLIDGAKDYAIFALDTEGKIATWNEGAKRLKGYDAGEIIGKHFSIFYSPADIAAGRPEASLRIAATQGRYIEEGLRYQKGGVPFFAHVDITPMRDASGRLCGYSKITRDITALKVAETQLAERSRDLEAALANSEIAKTAAESATVAKSQFLANMSHEIRTPLTSILGFTETALEGELSASEQREALEAVYQNGEHLLQIISDILDLSKIESGKIDIQCVRVSVSELIGDLDKLIAERAASKGLTFKIEYCYPMPLTVLTDPVRVKQILLNLLMNGVKFTEKGGIVLRVSCSSDRQELAFSVEDTGIGITEEQRSRLFQAFSQADSSTSRRFGGTGLGLLISKQLAELLGGTVTLFSKPGVGSVFAATISTGPLSEKDLTLEIGSSSGARTAPVPAPRLTGRVMLAEDGRDNERYITFLLKKMGLSVVHVGNGQLAVATAAKEQFDLILMDMQMPVMDGYTATELLRQAGCRAPIIALTANAMKSAVDRCLQSGCTDFMGKPFRRAEFFSKITKYLSGVRTDPIGAFDDPPKVQDSQNADPEFQEILREYIEDLGNQLLELEGAFARGDLERVKIVAHRLRGASGLYGHRKIGKITGLIEQAANLSRTTILPGLIKKLRLSVDRAQHREN